MSRLTGLVIMYGDPPRPGSRIINEKMAEFLGWPVCAKCKRHYKPDESCPFCAREAEKNYKALIDIEEGRR